MRRNIRSCFRQCREPILSNLFLTRPAETCRESLQSFQIDRFTRTGDVARCAVLRTWRSVGQQRGWQSREGRIWLPEIERHFEIRNLVRGVPRGEWLQPKAPLYQLENRGVIKHLVHHARALRSPSRKGRHQYWWDAHAKKSISIYQIRIDTIGRNHARRWNMLKKPSPFVEGEDQHCAGPCGRMR